MPTLDTDAFQTFARLHRRDFARIARATRGEHQADDVTNEAWLLAFELSARQATPLDFQSPAVEKLLLSHLYQRLVRFTETTVRHAVQLDHGRPGREEEGHPLLAMLASDEGRDPLALLMAHESQAHAAEPEAHQSLAGAYVRLLRHFDNHMPAVAHHLLISTRYAYARCAHARALTTRQHPIPLPSTGEGFLPGPWRRFRLQRQQVQLAFDFGPEPGLEV